VSWREGRKKFIFQKMIIKKLKQMNIVLTKFCWSIHLFVKKN